MTPRIEQVTKLDRAGFSVGEIAAQLGIAKMGACRKSGEVEVTE